jgi:hypothetical protein
MAGISRPFLGPDCHSRWTTQKGAAHNLQANIVTVFRAITTALSTRRFIDPANTNNIVSNVLTVDGKARIVEMARSALNSPWNTVFQ